MTETLFSPRFYHFTLNFKNQAKAISEGLIDGSPVKITKKTAKYSQTTDFMGNPQNYESMDDSGTLTIQVLEGSETSKLLYALYEKQKNSSANNDNRFNFVMTNDATGQSTDCQNCRIAGEPEVNANKAQQSVSWTILAGRVETVSDKPTDAGFVNG